MTTQTRTSKASDYKDAIHAAFRFGHAVTGELVSELRVRGSRKKAGDFIETLQPEESPLTTGNQSCNCELRVRLFCRAQVYTAQTLVCRPAGYAQTTRQARDLR
ncbi:hypothetical protein QYH69_02810 [Paraburkholderia sp. SARCC-3016]|uniref:hypothetical protein n=1 Tax=Paraburkholderia sp. SARCC-3016 TaxID=3058611 RepID=UPI002807E653|nr:hypothetical protein [Paraburkholderia sp. SARCC-3016]MDQ7976174.1 hypothetical protein [Paraburkholderia sp. SARCC-3016]